MGVDAPTRKRRELVTLAELEEGDVCEVNVVIEGDDTDWVKRTVIARDLEGGDVTFKAPEGWEEGREYTIPAKATETIWRVWRPCDAPFALADRVLGEAVHPRAVERLFELWPDAYVEVHHAPKGMVPRFTVVKVWASKQDHDEDLASPVSCSATCHPDDQFDRKAGIAIAFKRVLLKVKEVTEGGRRA